MADAVSAGTLAAVEELVTPPPAKSIPSISAAAKEDAVVGLFCAWIRIVFLRQHRDRCGGYFVWLRFVRRYVDRHRRLSSGCIVFFPPPGSPPVCLRVV